MTIAIEPTFHCVAVKNAAEMGPHPEPRLRAAVRRHTAAPRFPKHARQDRQRVLVIGDGRSYLDRAGVVAAIGLVAVVLGLVAARL